MENQIKLADQYAAHFWQAFGARAAMDMDEACVEVARERGYYGHVEGNAVNFDEHSYLWKKPCVVLVELDTSRQISPEKTAGL